MAIKYKHSINMAIQAAHIKLLFPNSNLSFTQNRLVWRESVTPSPLSNSYIVELIYIRNEHPNVFVRKPTLKLYPGAFKLEHVYDTDKQWLCLYRRSAKQWQEDMLISDTIIPWACEWLLHHELWVSTGIWNGGGIHNATISDKTKDINPDE